MERDAGHAGTLKRGHAVADLLETGPEPPPEPLNIIARVAAGGIKSLIGHDKRRSGIGRKDIAGEGRCVGFDAAIARGLAYAPYADLIWCETSTPNLEDAKRFAEAIRKAHPDQMLAYNCSPSFNWAKYMGEAEMEAFQRELGAMGYKYQFITLAGFHNLSLTTFNLARKYKARGMAAYSELQQAEFAAEAEGFSATRHQREVGTSYFDAVATAITQGQSATTAMADSTETAQFH